MKGGDLSGVGAGIVVEVGGVTYVAKGDGTFVRTFTLADVLVKIGKEVLVPIFDPTRPAETWDQVVVPNVDAGMIIIVVIGGQKQLLLAYRGVDDSFVFWPIQIKGEVRDEPPGLPVIRIVDDPEFLDSDPDPDSDNDIDPLGQTEFGDVVRINDQLWLSVERDDGRQAWVEIAFVGSPIEEGDLLLALGEGAAEGPDDYFNVQEPSQG